MLFPTGAARSSRTPGEAEREGWSRIAVRWLARNPVPPSNAPGVVRSSRGEFPSGTGRRITKKFRTNRRKGRGSDGAIGVLRSLPVQRLRQGTRPAPSNSEALSLLTRFRSAPRGKPHPTTEACRAGALNPAPQLLMRTSTTPWRGTVAVKLSWNVPRSRRAHRSRTCSVSPTPIWSKRTVIGSGE